MTQPVGPPVEMLWETDAPDLVLAHRFGFGDPDAAAQWVAATASKVWGITVDSCDRIVMSDHNALAWIRSGSESYVAKWSVDPERFARLSAVSALTEWLAERGVPTSAPVPALDGRLQVEIDAASVGLQREVAGELLDVSSDDQVRAAGAELARLHLSLAGYPLEHALLSESASGRRPLVERISAWLESPRSKEAPEAALRHLRRLVASKSTEPQWEQLVHGDFRSANILVAGRSVTAILDFEEARYDFAILELAQAAVLLGTRYRDWGPVSMSIRAAFLAGYQMTRPLHDVELQWWDTLVLWLSLMFIPAGDDPTGWRVAAGELFPET